MRHRNEAYGSGVRRLRASLTNLKNWLQDNLRMLFVCSNSEHFSKKSEDAFEGTSLEVDAVDSGRSRQSEP